MSDISTFFLGCLILSSSFLLLRVKNPVHSVLLLVLVFVNSAVLLIGIGVEFLALMLIIIYVGAIAILFLFIVMMLDLKIVKKDEKFISLYSIEIILIKSFSSALLFLVFLDFHSMSFSALDTNTFWFFSEILTDLQCLGQMLYTYYFVYFLLGGILLLIGMVGAIVLTLSTKKNSKAQSVFRQLSRKMEKATFVAKFKN